MDRERKDRARNEGRRNSGVRRLGVAMVAAVLAVSGAAVLRAQDPIPPGAGTGGLDMGPHRPPMERALGPAHEIGRFWNNPKIVEKFKLTDAQRKAMDDIYQQHRLTLVDLHATLEKAELTLEPLISADQPDEGKILQQIDRVAQARAELEKANARMLLGIRRELTPEQWKELKAAWTAHREGRGLPGGPGALDGRRWREPGGPGGPATGGSGAGTPPPPSGPGNEE